MALPAIVWGQIWEMSPPNTSHIEPTWEYVGFHSGLQTMKNFNFSDFSKYNSFKFGPIETDLNADGQEDSIMPTKRLCVR